MRIGERYKIYYYIIIHRHIQTEKNGDIEKRGETKRMMAQCFWVLKRIRVRRRRSKNIKDHVNFVRLVIMYLSTTTTRYTYCTCIVVGKSSSGAIKISKKMTKMKEKREVTKSEDYIYIFSFTCIYFLSFCYCF